MYFGFPIFLRFVFNLVSNIFCSTNSLLSVICPCSSVHTCLTFVLTFGIALLCVYRVYCSFYHRCDTHSMASVKSNWDIFHLEISLSLHISWCYFWCCICPFNSSRVTSFCFSYCYPPGNRYDFMYELRVLHGKKQILLR